MKKRTAILTAAALAVACSVWFSVRRNYYHHKEPPPGWGLVTNVTGEWMAAYPNGHVIDQRYERAFRFGKGTRQGAINRAWAQYEHEQNSGERAKSWKPVGH